MLECLPAPRRQSFLQRIRGDEGGMRIGVTALTLAQLAERMMAFKNHQITGANATVMPLMMQGYSATQIEALAQWFSKETP